MDIHEWCDNHIEAYLSLAFVLFWLSVGAVVGWIGAWQWWLLWLPPAVMLGAVVVFLIWGLILPLTVVCLYLKIKEWLCGRRA